MCCSALIFDVRIDHINGSCAIVYANYVFILYDSIKKDRMQISNHHAMLNHIQHGVTITNSALSNNGTDCKIFRDGGRGEIVLPKKWLLSGGFFGTYHHKNKLEQKDSCSKKWQE
jgi:hypothetical protein